MRIAIGSDHAGYELKAKILEYLKNYPYEIIDCGTDNGEKSVDYPDYAEVVAKKISEQECAYGILVCGTGIGMSIAANKVHGVRAALIWSNETAKLSREHNNANIICLGGRTTPEEDALEFLETWLNTEFLGGRHERRLKEIAALEKTS